MSRALAPFRQGVTALRLAWRELRRDPRQGLLIALLVALPAVILTLVSVVNASQQPTVDQRIVSQLGSNEAWVQVVGGDGATVIQSSTDPTVMSVQDPSDGDYGERDLASLLPAGTRILTLGTSRALVTSGDAAGTMTVVVGPAWDPAFAGKYNVIAGAAPVSGNEVMVSEALAQRWRIAAGDELTVGRDGDQYTVTGVIATPHAYDSGSVFGSATALAAPLQGSAAPLIETAYLPDAALDWDSTHALLSNGVAVYSRTVANDPPPEYLHRAENAGYSVDGTDGIGGAAALGIGLGMLEVVLLGAAAFTVSMRRRQERLALLAATGAGRGTLVGVGMWNGALLGAAGGLIGIPVGLAVGALWLWALAAWGDASTQVWGFHVSWWQLAAVLVFTTVAGTTASLIPAVAASRLDVMAALRGSRRPGRARRWPIVVGGVFLAGGASAVVYSAHMNAVAWNTPEYLSETMPREAEQVALLGVLAIFVGLIALAPATLRLAARLMSPLGVGARIAARDGARHPGRTVPVVAVIAVTVLAAGNTMLDNFRDVAWATQGERYQAQPGDGVVNLSMVGFDEAGDSTVIYGDADAIATAAQRVVPGVATVEVDQAGQSDLGSPDSDYTVARVAAASVCPAWDPETQMYQMGTMTRREVAEDPRCRDGGGHVTYPLAVGGPEQLEYLLGRAPTEAELSTLARGGAVTFEPLMVAPDAAPGAEGTMTLERWEGFPDEGTLTATATVPVVVADSAHTVSWFSTLLSPDAAAAIGAEVMPGYLFLRHDGGFSDLQEDQIRGAVMSQGDLTFWVSYPIDWQMALLAWGSVIATLLVAGAAAGLALGLARADARRDDITLVSLGASPSVARAVAAWQGALIVGIAGGIGMVCALILDVVRAGATLEGGSLQWGVLVVGLLVPPAVVGAAAWVMTRTPQPAHFRLAA